MWIPRAVRGLLRHVLTQAIDPREECRIRGLLYPRADLLRRLGTQASSAQWQLLFFASINPFVFGLQCTPPSRITVQTAYRLEDMHVVEYIIGLASESLSKTWL